MTRFLLKLFLLYCLHKVTIFSLQANKEERMKGKKKIKVMFQGQRIHLFPDITKSTLLSLCRFMNIKTEFVGEDVKECFSFIIQKKLRLQTEEKRYFFHWSMMPTGYLIFNLDHIRTWTYQRWQTNLYILPYMPNEQIPLHTFGKCHIRKQS